MFSERSPRGAQPPHSTLQAFLEDLHCIGIGPLAELEGRLLEAKALHAHALRMTSPQAEREALSKVESCAKQASAAAALANRRLQGLVGEVHGGAPGTTESNLRRQSFTGECARYQSLVGQLFEAQQEFKTQMEAKVRRQLRTSEQSAEDITAGVLSQSAPAAGGGLAAACGGRSIADTTLEVMEENNEELLMLARAAEDLRQAFMDVESLVSVQGDRLEEVDTALARTEGRTRAANEHLLQAHQARRRSTIRWCIVSSIIVGLLVVIAVTLGVEEENNRPVEATA